MNSLMWLSTSEKKEKPKGLVIQWIEYISPKDKIRVRFPARLRF